MCLETWRAVVRITEGVRTTEAGRPAGEAATETDQVQAAVVRREVSARQDADAQQRRRRQRANRRHRHRRA